MRVILTFLLFCCSLTGALAAGTLKPGDAVHITVWQDPKLDRTVVIGPDGQFGFPLAGHIRAAGRTPEAVERILRSRLEKKYTGDLDISVTLATVDPAALEDVYPKIYITGEVLRPGPYSIRSRTTIAQAIALAGGVSPFAARQRVQVHRQFRGADSIFLFDYNAYQYGHVETDNIDLRSGDVIIVPERGLFE
jgi:polysaccharide export outer membrane protein